MMMFTATEISELKLQHKTERDSRVSDRIKAVILHSKGWSNIAIAEALLIHVDTVGDHLRDYFGSRKLKPENGGSKSHLNEAETAELISHIEANTYTNTAAICAYILAQYGVIYTVAGLTNWLHNHNFSYKQPKGTPAKADPKAQEAFIAEYEQLMASTPLDEPIVFGDGVHPTMATKISYGWIRTGKDKLIQTTASRTRMNIFGSLNLESMSVTATKHDTLDSVAMEEHFKQLAAAYPEAPKIHMILDRGSYNTSKDTASAADKCRIILHFLPPYSPNLNPIERLWKVMNEYVRNNRFFRSSGEFRQGITEFFEVTWPKISGSMVDRINDNFSVVKTVPST